MISQSVMNESRYAARPAFTLVEVLVVLVLISILSGMVMTAVRGVNLTARQARTRSIIAIVDTVIQEQYESYKYRPLAVEIPNLNSMIPTGVLKFEVLPSEAARARLNMIRDLQRMELPDRISDITSDPSASTPAAILAALMTVLDPPPCSELGTAAAFETRHVLLTPAPTAVPVAPVRVVWSGSVAGPDIAPCAWVWVHPSAQDHALQALDAAVAASAAAQAGVTVVLLPPGTLVRLELIGARAHAIMASSLFLASSTSPTAARTWEILSSVQSPTILADGAILAVQVLDPRLHSRLQTGHVPLRARPPPEGDAHLAHVRSCDVPLLLSRSFL